MKILLMGPQASGKGTQGEKLSELTGLPLLSVGEVLRHVTHSHPRYNELNEAMNKGELVSMDIVGDLLRYRTSQDDCKDGFILDGWGRAVSNIAEFNPGFDAVLVIKIPREESLKRITGRRLCTSDGKTYNIYTMPQEDLVCKGELIQRADDTEEAVNRRLEIYYTETQKVLDMFKHEGKLLEIDGMGTPDEVFERVKLALADKLGF